MNFKLVSRFFYASVLVVLIACSDAEDETHLVNVLTLAEQDIIDISFPAETTETTLSINSQYDFTLQGLKSNGVDRVVISDHVQWSLSEGAVSRIDQQGRLSAGNSAETLTLSAQFGFLTESIEIRISSAQFDRVIQLDEQEISIDMCRSKAITPIGRYVDENGDEEIRPVDTTIIDTIDWVVLDQQDGVLSQRAYIETIDNKAVLHALAPGNVIIQAHAVSLYTGNEETSADLNQEISNGLNSIKLCLAGVTDLASCQLTDTTSIKKDEVASFIAVGNYQADDSSFNENISALSKWGISDTDATIAFSSGRQQLDVSGKKEGSDTSISVACGEIEQSLDGVDDIAQGVTLDSAVSCGSMDCLFAMAEIQILSFLSFEVSANGFSLTHDVRLTLAERPAEISLVVKANYSNGSQPDITDDNGLSYRIITIDGQDDVIEENTGTNGVFTVLAAGTAKIELEYRDKTFIALIEVP